MQNPQVTHNLLQSKRQGGSHISWRKPHPTHPQPLNPFRGHSALGQLSAEFPHRQPLICVLFSCLLYLKPASSGASSPQQVLQVMGPSSPLCFYPWASVVSPCSTWLRRDQGLAHFLVKSHVVNILRCVGYAVFVPTTQHCHYTTKSSHG